MRALPTGVLIAIVAAVAPITLAAQWPQFRGANGAGVGEGAGYPVEFSPTKNLAWRTEVPFGQSSPVIVGTRLYLTARDGDRLITLALDAGTGAELWRRDIRRERATEMYKANDPASPTPAADGDGVVSFSVNDLGDEVNAAPALAGGRVYVRTRGVMYCFAQPAPGR